MNSNEQEILKKVKIFSFRATETKQNAGRILQKMLYYFLIMHALCTWVVQLLIAQALDSSDMFLGRIQNSLIRGKSFLMTFPCKESLEKERLEECTEASF